MVILNQTQLSQRLDKEENSGGAQTNSRGFFELARVKSTKNLLDLQNSRGIK